MLTSEERAKLISALREWASSVPNEPMLGFIQSGALKTPNEIVQEVIGNTPDGQALMQMIEHGVRRIGLEAAVHKLQARRGLMRGI